MLCVHIANQYITNFVDETCYYKMYTNLPKKIIHSFIAKLTAVVIPIPQKPPWWPQHKRWTA